MVEARADSDPDAALALDEGGATLTAGQLRTEALLTAAGLRDLGIEPVLDAIESELVETARLRGGERFENDVGERWSAPHRQRPSCERAGKLARAGDLGQIYRYRRRLGR